MHEIGASRSFFTALFVGLGRVELPTSPLSGVRSNQLSYSPEQCGVIVAGPIRSTTLFFGE